MPVNSALSSYSTLPEPELLLAGNRPHKHPLVGLITSGPYSLRFGFPGCVRLALVAPRQHMAKLTSLVDELRKEARPREAINYYPVYPGFEQVFRTPVVPPEQRDMI